MRAVSMPRVQQKPAEVEHASAWESQDDAQLVERSLGGDRWADEALYRRHARRIAGTAMRLLGDRHEAEDVVQDAFVQAFSELTKLRDPTAFGPWLLQIMVRKVHRRFRRRRFLGLLGFTHEGDLPLDSLLSETASPEHVVELRLIQETLGRASAAERTAWTLRHVEGYRLAEIASACGCSLATAKRRIEAARLRIDSHTRGIR